MNCSRFAIYVLVAAAVLIPMRLRAQSEPSAFQGRAALWVGVDYANVSASFPYQSGNRLSGIAAFADLNWRTHLSLEGEAQFLHWGGFAGDSENSYLAGPRYRFNRIGPLHPYVKTLIGVGHINFPYDIGNASYFAVAPGGGAAYYLQRHWLVRAEYEYQFWLDSPGYAGQPDHPFHPNGFKVGLAFRL